jgi:SAM-dependent methyltransferase
MAREINGNGLHALRRDGWRLSTAVGFSTLPPMLRSLIPLPVRRALGGRFDAWRAARARRALLRSLRGDAVACNVCGWVGGAFTDDCWHPGTICPNCRSQVRHRMLAACLDGQAQTPGLTQPDLLDGQSVLHFAPERQLRERIRAAASRYESADFERGDCDHRLDISAMPEIGDARFDVVIACDVLEHVPDDAAAFLEIRRVLKPGGIAILSVPQKDSPAATDEDPGIVSESAREARFGQKDHVRMYGDDFFARLKCAGFAVTQVDRSAFSETIVAHHVLHPPIPNPNPLATNQRRMYFASISSDSEMQAFSG